MFLTPLIANPCKLHAELVIPLVFNIWTLLRTLGSRRLVRQAVYVCVCNAIL